MIQGLLAGAPVSPVVQNEAGARKAVQALHAGRRLAAGLFLLPHESLHGVRWVGAATGMTKASKGRRQRAVSLNLWRRRPPVGSLHSSLAALPSDGRPWTSVSASTTSRHCTATPGK